MAAQTERITILGTPDFKSFLMSEAAEEGISMSELVRRRCLRRSGDEEEALAVLVEQVKTATAEAKRALDQGVEDAEAVLAELRGAGA